MDEHNIDQSDWVALVNHYKKGGVTWGELKNKYKVKMNLSPIDSSNEDKIRDKYGPDLPEFVNLISD
tara:strand:- start:827 stop:1027 length:201 start_codon:yes stop_codon:yes gene_type:complete